MKLQYSILVLLLIVFSSACSSDRKKQEKYVEPKLNSFLFRTEYFISNAEQHFSFPNWFNEKILTKKKVQTITHSWYSLSSEEEVSSALQKSRKYTFNASGELLTVQQKRFYENLVVENITLTYPEAPDALGFVAVKAFDSLHPNESLEYATYRKEEYQKAYAVYEDNSSGDFLFCLMKKRFQGIVSVDSLFTPTPDDIVQYGSPMRPFKRYQIENLVEENNVQRFGYFKESSELQYLVSENYPFSNKTTITVDGTGKCVGYIDSTFSADEYLNRTVSTFSFDKNNLPSRLTHTGMRNGNYETFEYSFFQ